MAEGTPTSEPAGAAAYDATTWEAVDRWVDYRLWQTRTPGAQVAVGIGGAPLFSRAYGFADLESRTPMRLDHLFRIASHSKTFTATLVLQLVDEGRVGLDDPVGRHVPELDGEVADVRLRELLEHTGGLLRDSRDADFWLHRRPFPNREEVLALALEGGLKAAPGERFAYSNIGYGLLGLAIENVTGTSFAEAARAGITVPLGLADTAAEYLGERAGDYAAGYTGLHTGPRRRSLGHVVTGALAPATGFTSTATDLVTYFGAHALGDERLLSDRTKRLQQRRANDADPAEASAGGYGLGMVTESIDATTYVGHSGGYPGHITKTLLDPVTGLVISVLTNATDGPATPLARGIAQLLAEARDPHAERRTLSEATLSRTGRYADDWGVLDLAALNGRLRTLTLGGWAPLEGADELVEDGPDRLRISAGPGYGSVGEPVTFPEAGATARQMRYGGMSMRPAPVLDEPDGYRLGG
jgi:CubicO group peptidase (beta-lactamase class C family)